MKQIILTSTILFALLLCTCTAPATTPATTPESTSVPAEATGVLKGKLTEADSGSPIEGATIVLGLVTSENKCIFKTDLSSTVNEKGVFEISEVPPGLYIVFYDPSGQNKSTWENIDGIEMYTGVEGIFTPQAPTYAIAREELFSTFGGGGNISIKKETLVETRNGILSSVNGGIISDKYGLHIDFYDGNPITADIKANKVTEIEIKAWA